MPAFKQERHLECTNLKTNQKYEYRTHVEVTMSTIRRNNALKDIEQNKLKWIEFLMAFIMPLPVKTGNFRNAGSDALPEEIGI